MAHNKSPILLCEGKAFLDGVECFDSLKFKIVLKPRVWTGRQLGEITNSTRWCGYDITGEITRRRATPFLKETLQKYKDSGETPEFTFQGVMTDSNSDYGKKYGTDTITAVGCVLTGDIVLIEIESESTSVKQDVIPFNAKEVV